MRTDCLHLVTTVFFVNHRCSGGAVAGDRIDPRQSFQQTSAVILHDLVIIDIVVIVVLDPPEFDGFPVCIGIVATCFGESHLTGLAREIHPRILYHRL